MDTILKVEDINVYYGSIHAIKGVSFEVNEGEIVTLIGANGAGKSTTLRAISGLEKAQSGEYPMYFKKGMTAADVTAKTVAEAADAGDETAIEVYRICGEYLGRGLSVIIDLLNPEVIVIGSIFARSRNLLWEPAKKVIEKEALSLSANCCRVVPAELGEKIGDYAAVAAALL